MKPVVVRNIAIGTGMPVVCLPVVAEDNDQIIEQLDEIATAAKNIPKYVVEWRVDWYQALLDSNAVKGALQLIRDKIGNMPLLFTIRSKREGGMAQLSFHEYGRVCVDAIESGLVDMIDVELFSAEKTINLVVNSAKANKVCVIMSNHDFKKTPTAAAMVTRLEQMEEFGCDICKIAVMPKKTNDVLKLLTAASRFAEKSQKPLVAMSMGGKGVISRLSGEVFGSAMTFGCAGRASAPGQINAEKLYQVLNIIHESI